MTAASRALHVAPAASLRLARAAAWLAAFPPSREVLLVGDSTAAIHDLARETTLTLGSSFGWHRHSLAGLAATLAAARLAELGLAPVGGLALEAVAARVVQRAREAGRLGRFSPIGDRPGFPRALARTFGELRMAEAATRGMGELGELLADYEIELDTAKLADRATMLRLATLAATDDSHPLLALPLLLLDLSLVSASERDFVSALAARSRDVMATAPSGDEPTISRLVVSLGVGATREDTVGDGALARLQRGLFADSIPEPRELDDRVMLLSAPGEIRECVEIARQIHRQAERGVAFDRMAILLRSPAHYASAVEEALGRAGIPAYFSRGTHRPDPAGRAFLALLACAAEGLSARRFAEYLSLGELPPPQKDGSPPEAAAEVDRFAPSEEETAPRVAAWEDKPAPGDDRVSGLRTPRLWERLLVDAAVLGGRDRWERRLRGLRKTRELSLGSTQDEPAAARIAAEIVLLDALLAFALPLITDLDALPVAATWGDWIEQLSRLATRAIRRPERILATLAELSPMAAVGPVTLREVRQVLGTRLTELPVPPPARRYGRVFVGSALEARGLAFDVVFVPGLAEKLFPRKVVEDPILRDSDRREVSDSLVTNEARVAEERLALRLAIGAARERVVLSYPRIDGDQGRPRTPSFYGLEVLRAAEGRLPGWTELATRAEAAATTRMGWPAPARAEEAIDHAEYDLSLLARVLALPADQTVGAARYLLSANTHLPRALRARAGRFRKGWFSADGLVQPSEEAKLALAKHTLGARAYSPTALQRYAACPYRFFLSAVQKLSPRAEIASLEEMDPLQRGSLVHEVEYDLHVELRDRGLLPVREHNLDQARALMEAVLRRVAARYRDDLAPAIARVWDDGIQSIETDFRERLRRAAQDPDWTPSLFELSFGRTEEKKKDPSSQDTPVSLDCGIQLSGSIDVVERSHTGALRATDYKTGKPTAQVGVRIGGGEILQPIFYALAVEKLVPGSAVEGGRLYYCTSTGEFRSVEIPLDDEAREDARTVASTIGEALTDGFLPALPKPGVCEHCDYLPVCGPHEESRTGRKVDDPRLTKLRALRKLP